MRASDTVSTSHRLDGVEFGDTLRLPQQVSLTTTEREREHEKLFPFLLDIVLPLWHLYELHDGQCGRCLPSMRAVYIEQLLQAYGASQ